MEGVTHENWGWLTLNQGCFYPKTRHEIGVRTGGFCVKLECFFLGGGIRGLLRVIYLLYIILIILYYTRVRTEIFCNVHTLTLLTL